MTAFRQIGVRYELAPINEHDECVNYVSTLFGKRDSAGHIALGLPSVDTEPTLSEPSKFIVTASI